MKLTGTEKDILKKWIAALRSGEYKQGNYVLKYENEKGVHHCCLGVLCEVVGVDGFHRMKEDTDLIEIGDSLSICWGIDHGEYFDSEEIPYDIAVDNNIGFLFHDFELEKKKAPLFKALIDMNDLEKLSFDDISHFLENHFEV